MSMTALPTGNENKKSFSIYLAGAFEKLEAGGMIYLDWRDYVMEKLSKEFPSLKFYNPLRDTPQYEIAAFVFEDSFGVRENDVTFYYMTNNAGDIGAGSEITIGSENNKLTIICLGPKVNSPHAFIIGKARRVFIGLDIVIIYFLKLAEFGFSVSGELKAYEYVMNYKEEEGK